MDVEFFSNLLEKILAIGKKKKVKSPTEKKVRKARQSKPKGKERLRTLPMTRPCQTPVTDGIALTPVSKNAT